MKVYARTTDDPNKDILSFLRPYAETEFWVKCKDEFGGEHYMQLISIMAGLVSYNFITDYDIHHHNAYMLNHMGRRCSIKQFERTFKVCQPLDILTTDEVMEALKG